MKGVSKTVIAFGLDGFFGVLIRVFFYRLSTPSDYGYIGYLATSAYFFAVFSLLGIDYALIYSLSKEREYTSNLFTAAFLLPLTGFLGDLLITHNPFSAILAYASALAFAGTSSLVGRRKYNALFALVFSKRSIQAIGMVMLYSAIGPDGAVIGIALSMIPGIIALLACSMKFGLRLAGIGKTAKEVAALTGSIVLLTASLYVDKVIVGHILTFEEFSGYYLAFQAILLFNAIADATMRSSASEFSAIGSIDRFSKAFIVFLSIATPIATYVFAPVIPMILGRSAEAYVDVIRLTGLYLPAAMPLVYSIGYLTSKDRKREIFAATSTLITLRALMPAIGALIEGVIGALLGFILATAMVGIPLALYVRANREKFRF